MRLVFGVMSLLIVMSAVGVLVKKQLGATPTSQNAAPPSQAAAAHGNTNLSMQSQWIEQQIQQAAEAAMQRKKVADTQ